eukprot:NODE_379_length_8451_cov_0.593630.p2 type:complete len:427 gc:universal NODE_379_length_8451_cov_0.593630:2823-4103(+)
MLFLVLIFLNLFCKIEFHLLKTTTMTVHLNKEIFKKTVSVKALKVRSQYIGQLKLELKNLIIKIPGIKPIQNSDSNDEKLLLLMGECPQQLLDRYGCTQNDLDIHLDYNNFTMHQVLTGLLPKSMDIPSSYESVGHIAHLNLRDEQLPYKFAIGSIFLDKLPNIKTVVNKTEELQESNPFRILPFELLAGENNFIAKVRETSCHFEFDFSKVYWNSRLQMEHLRLTTMFKPSEYVADVFAGVGPFAIPTAKNCVVFANDLNPDSYLYLNHNSKANKVVNRLYSYNLDGNEFIKNSLDFLNQRRDEIEQNLNKKNSKAKKARINIPTLLFFDHYILNLPATAINFCGSFRNIWPREAPLPLIHLYSFFKGNQNEAEVKLKCEINNKFGRDANAEFKEWTFVDVRNVGPNKNMYCMTFKLPEDIAFVK